MTLRIFLMITGIAFTIIGCSQPEEDIVDEPHGEERTNELILAVGGEPDEGFDPAAGWGRYGSPLFQSTLLSRDQDLSVTTDLAENYYVSDDGLTWTVEIRQDAKFSDGEPVTAADVVFTFETAAASGSVIDLSNMAGVKQVDDYTIQFNLKEPQSVFVSQLVTTGIIPKHAYEDNYPENPVGSGPYQMVQWDKGQQLIVEANPYYYGKEPFFEKLTFLFLEEDTAFAAAKAGNVDIVSIPPAFADQEVAGMELVTLESVDNRGIMFPYLEEGEETDDELPIGNNVTSDSAIRKSINIAVDREALAGGVLGGFGTPAYSSADGLPWWNPDTVIEDGDMDLAGDILDEAGWHMAEDGVREKEGLRAEFTLLYPTGDEVRQALSIAFAEMIKPLGINVIPEGKSWSEIENLVHSQPVMMGWGSHDPLEMYNLYNSDMTGQGWYNANYYSNDVVDIHLNEALLSSSEEEALEHWKKAQWDGETGFSVLGDAPWAWLVNLEHLYFVREGLDIGEQKVQPHGHGWPVTDFITEWSWEE